jgi:beta-glucosidase
MMLDRRTLLATGAAAGASLIAGPALAAAKRAANPTFPKGFFWGASTAPHQIEGNNTASDLWFLENQQPTVFNTPSGDACNSFELWATDLDLARAMGLNAYRFGIEWARIEPEKGLVSRAMLDHYKALIAGCHARGLSPIVTFNHFTAPRWFSAQGGWTNPEAPALFARFCDIATRALGDGITSAITFNEPNITLLLQVLLPKPVWDISKLTADTAAKRLGVPKFIAANVCAAEDVAPIQTGLLAAHKAGKAAIKAVRGDLPVGFSLSMVDDQAVGRNSMRDRIRHELYGAWLDLARADDFMGVQNYERALWNDHGRIPAPAGAVVNWSGTEVYAPSLGNAVRYAHSVTGKPVLVSEHGVGTDDDTIRAKFIPESLVGLKAAIDDGVPVLGYCHWSLIDNFEWIFGYKPHFGLHSVDRVTFARTAKPSALVLGAIACRNALA